MHLSLVLKQNLKGATDISLVQSWIELFKKQNIRTTLLDLVAGQSGQIHNKFHMSSSVSTQKGRRTGTGR